MAIGVGFAFLAAPAHQVPGAFKETAADGQSLLEHRGQFLLLSTARLLGGGKLRDDALDLLVKLGAQFGSMRFDGVARGINLLSHR